MKKIIFFTLSFIAIVIFSSPVFWFQQDSFELNGHYWLNVYIVFVAYFLANLVIQTFNNFPGNRSSMSVLPSVLGSFAFVFLCVALLGLSYSIAFIAMSFLCAVFFGYVGFAIARRTKKVMAFIPFGKGQETYRLPNIHWVRLDEPKLPKESISAIVVDLRSPQLTDEWQHFLAEKTLEGISVFNTRQVEEALTGRVKIHHMYENDLGSLLPSPIYTNIKLLIEVVLVLLSFPVVLPVMAVTAALIKLESQGGIFFIQNRVGRGGKEFKIYKFRSMCADSEKDGAQFASAGDMRVTRVGKFIRKTRIDELPQFFNILKGEMSLIGPRPEQKVFVKEFEETVPFYNYRHIVRPGISGWAQVVHGYAADSEATQVKVEHDFYYIKHYSFSLDALIFFKTFKTMLTGFGAR